MHVYLFIETFNFLVLHAVFSWNFMEIFPTQCSILEQKSKKLTPLLLPSPPLLTILISTKKTANEHFKLSPGSVKIILKYSKFIKAPKRIMRIFLAPQHFLFLENIRSRFIIKRTLHIVQVILYCRYSVTHNTGCCKTLRNFGSL